MMAGFGVEPGLVRTAISRLVADGWFERTRLGKHSYYRLSAQRAAEFAAATTRIYRARDPAWSGEMDIAIITSSDAALRAAHRDRMLGQGYGQAAANVMLRPHISSASGDPQPDPSDVISMVTRPESEKNAKALAQACWQLDELAVAYGKFLEAFGPVAQGNRGRRPADRCTSVSASRFAGSRLAPHRAARPVAPARDAAGGLAGDTRAGADCRGLSPHLAQLGALAGSARRRPERRPAVTPTLRWKAAS